MNFIAWDQLYYQTKILKALKLNKMNQPKPKQIKNMNFITLDSLN